MTGLRNGPFRIRCRPKYLMMSRGFITSFDEALSNLSNGVDVLVLGNGGLVSVKAMTYDFEVSIANGRVEVRRWPYPFAALMEALRIADGR